MFLMKVRSYIQNELDLLELELFQEISIQQLMF